MDNHPGDLPSKSKAPSETSEPEEKDKTEAVFSVDLPPHDIVFSFDHILENIFSLLDTPDLFSCRQVSHRFLFFARHPLEKRICKSFSQRGFESLDVKDSDGRTLTQLTEFLEHSKSTSSKSNRTLISFPCTDFRFTLANLQNGSFRNFLQSNGQNIRELAIHLIEQGNPLNMHLNEEVILMEQLRILLTRDAPHIESLSLFGLHPTVKWHRANPAHLYRSTLAWLKNYPLLETDTEFKQISSRVEFLPSKSNLKILQISGTGFAKTLEFLIQFSPNLEEVILEKEYHVLYFMQPVNRIHLLKKLSSTSTTICHNISSSLTSQKTPLENFHFRLRELKICLASAFPLKFSSEDQTEVVLMIDRMLESSKDTLEILIVSSIVLVRKITMPTTMPKLRFLEIERAGSDRTNEENSAVFPSGFFMTEAFSKLTCIKLSYVPQMHDFEAFYRFLNCLNSGRDEDGTALSLGVKKVILNTKWFTYETIPARIYQKILTFFPNSSIEIEGL